MKAAKRVALATMALLTLAGLLVLALSVLSINFKYDLGLDNMVQATVKNPVTSPSGQYQLQVVGGYDGQVHFNRFYIAKIREVGLIPEVVYCSKDTFRTRDTLFFLWDNTDRVWVYSGDAGTFYWTRVRDDLWEKHPYADGDIPAPEFLKKVRPEYHKY